MYDFEQNRYHSYIHMGEKKTGKWKAIALNKTVAAASRLCFGSEMGQPADFLFRTSRKARAAVGGAQAWRQLGTRRRPCCFCLFTCLSVCSSRTRTSTVMQSVIPLKIEGIWTIYPKFLFENIGYVSIAFMIISIACCG